MTFAWPHCQTIHATALAVARSARPLVPETRWEKLPASTQTVLCNVFLHSVNHSVQQSKAQILRNSLQSRDHRCAARSALGEEGGQSSVWEEGHVAFSEAANRSAWEGGTGCIGGEHKCTLSCTSSTSCILLNVVSNQSIAQRSESAVCKTMSLEEFTMWKVTMLWRL